MLKNILKDELKELKIEMEENINYLSYVGEKEIKKYERKCNKIFKIIQDAEEENAKTNIVKDALHQIYKKINEASQRVPIILYKEDTKDIIGKINVTIEFLNSTKV